jgi:hypothetical protein
MIKLAHKKRYLKKTFSQKTNASINGKATCPEKNKSPPWVKKVFSGLGPGIPKYVKLTNRDRRIVKLPV